MYVYQLPLARPQVGTWLAIHTCALTGNQSSDPSVCRPAPHPLSHTSQGWPWFSTLSLSLFFFFFYCLWTSSPPFMASVALICWWLTKSRSACVFLLCLKLYISLPTLPPHLMFYLRSTMTKVKLIIPLMWKIVQIGSLSSTPNLLSYPPIC